MLFTFEVVKDLLSTIALMALLLAVGYGLVMRAFTRVLVAQMVLGALFGGAAIVAMLDPLHLTDGVIVDLRNVPVVLAGAFLGLPGAVVTTLLALATRVSIGGAGMLAGCAGVVVSALVGLGWTAFVRRPGHEVRNVLLLAMLSQLSLVSVFLLPWDAAWNSIITVWPVLVPLRFVGVLAVASLLKRERMIGNEVRQLGEATTHDPLTGFMNRQGFEAVVERAQCKRPGSALLVLALDHFERINDMHGRAAGDEVLQTLATRLRHALRSDDVVARFGGVEIVVFLPGLTSCATMDVASRLCEVVRSQPFMLPDGASVAGTVSVGGVWSSTIGMAWKGRLELLAIQAYDALYVAKNAGRDCWRLTVGERMVEALADTGHATLQQTTAA